MSSKLEKQFKGARLPAVWCEKILEIAQATGQSEADIFRDAIAAYLKTVNPAGVKAAIADHEQRISKLESKLSSLAGLN